MMSGPRITEPSSVSLLDELSHVFEHAPWAVTELSEAAHHVRYANPAFCQLIGKPVSEVIDKPFEALLPPDDHFREILDRVSRTGVAETHTTSEHSHAHPLLFSYSLWPVKADGRTAGVIVQVNETGQLHDTRQAISQALLLGALRQDRLVEVTTSANVRLETEIIRHRQRELDVRMLANEIAHRVKNNLQLVAALLGNERRKALPPWDEGYRATQDRIMAIAKLYDLMSQTSQGDMLDLQPYLTEIAKNLSASLLEGTGIRIVVDAAAIPVASRLCVPFGLLVNELTTNAIKHAFPDGAGLVTLALRMVDAEIELMVADDGIGAAATQLAAAPGKHGSDYVAIFVRQLGGTLAKSSTPGEGTTFRILFSPLSDQKSGHAG